VKVKGRRRWKESQYGPGAPAGDVACEWSLIFDETMAVRDPSTLELPRTAGGTAPSVAGVPSGRISYHKLDIINDGDASVPAFI